MSADLNWWPAYGALRDVGRVIAVDHRGHGRGMRSEEAFTLEAAADDAAGVLRALGVRSAVDVPAAVVFTTRDRLVRPKKQRALAAALRASVVELDVDHDVPWMRGPAFADATVLAVRSVLDAGHLRRSA